MRFFKPDLSSLGGVFKAPKLGPRHDKMAAHVSESPTTVLLPKGYDDVVNFLCTVVHLSYQSSHILFYGNLSFLQTLNRGLSIFFFWKVFLFLYFFFIECNVPSFHTNKKNNTFLFFQILVLNCCVF